jgi:O-antigen ligase
VDRGAAPAVPARKLKLTGALLFLYVMWFVILFDPQWWVASFGPRVVLRIPTLLFAVLLVITAVKGPRRPLAPLLAFVLYVVLSMPFAYIRGMALDVVKTVLAYYVLALATLTIVRQAREAVPIVLGALAVQFGVWVILGARTGQISWDYALFNYDAFGPIMVLGLAGLFYVGMATKERRWRVLAFVLAGGCIVGLVVSFARGAVLSAGVVAVWIWARSPHKLKNAVLGVGAVVVLFISARAFEGAKSAIEAGKTSTNFWTEMKSSFNPDDPTREDREVLWRLAMKVYVTHPLFGVGPNGFGAYAADHFAVGTTGGSYNDNPQTLWGRRLHNTYYQILSELGTVGFGLFVWMLWDFYGRNRKLREPQRMQAWAMRTGGRLDLRYLSLGLEASMLGFLLTGYFYNELFDVHWFYTLLTVNALLFYVTRPERNTVPHPAR